MLVPATRSKLDVQTGRIHLETVKSIKLSLGVLTIFMDTSAKHRPETAFDWRVLYAGVKGNESIPPSDHYFVEARNVQ
jgi:hypothetical protein